jgi:hypothetical protein
LHVPEPHGLRLKLGKYLDVVEGTCDFLMHDSSPKLVLVSRGTDGMLLSVAVRYKLSAVLSHLQHLRFEVTRVLAK